MKNGSPALKLAIGACGAAISLAFILLGALVFQNISMSLNIAASLGMMLPLSQKYYREAVIAYVSVVILGALIVVFRILPFALVSGGYTLIAILLHEKKVKPYIVIPLIAVYSSIVFFILYQITKLIIINLEDLNFITLSPTALYIIANIIFTICFIVYHYVAIYLYINVKQRLKIGK
ncbi:MAG: hypothetical protein LBE09_06240 [Christensenellaceae bacterium]|jgi:hypothetical protein|nr:hypothetical protein [Christensenellaceae bacterium]